MASLKGAFPSVTLSLLFQGSNRTVTFNMIDAASSVFTAGGGWSTGGMLTSRIPQTPGLGEAWDVTGWSTSLQLAILPPPFAGNIAGPGKLGTLYGALLSSGSIPSTPQPLAQQAAPPVIPQSALSSIQTVWDGSSAPAPPIVTPDVALAGQGLIAAGFSLQQPLEMESGDQLGIGLWLSASLGVNINTCVFNANYSIEYSPRAPAGWGG